jgi:hypothetical protein
MSSATQRFGASADPAQSAFNLALGTSEPFHRVRRERPKVRRQWSAYLSHVAGANAESKVADALMRLSWSNLGDACVVEVSDSGVLQARTRFLEWLTRVCMSSGPGLTRAAGRRAINSAG